MDEQLKLGIPDDEAATAPKQKFRLTARQSGFLSRLIVPLALAAWGFFAHKLVANDADRHSGHDGDPHHGHGPAPDQGGPQDVPAPRAETAAPQPQPAPTNIVQLTNFRPWHNPDSSGPFDPADFAFVSSSDAFHYPRHGSVPVRPQDALDTSFLADGRPSRGAPIAKGGSIPHKSEKASARRQNHKPVVNGPVRLNSGVTNQAMIITLGALLAGASDADGDTLSVRALVADSGKVEAQGDGTWLYTPDHDYAGPVTFHLLITDGIDAIVQTALAELVLPKGVELVGTEDGDTLTGTPNGDVLDGAGGNDILYGQAGDDVLFGGAGDDLIYGGAGDDVIYGGAGNDRLFGEAGSDALFGGTGDDVLTGGDGNDILYGGAGADAIYGGAGQDVADGGAGNDVISGGAGDDRVFGQAGDDVISGDAGNDVIDGGSGDDVIYGNAEVTDPATDPEAVAAADTTPDNDLISAGDGNDHVYGQAGDDVISGDAGDDYLDGGTGNDVIYGGTGNDQLFGGAGDDALDGGAGCDILHAGAGRDILIVTDSEGGDILDGGENEDRLDLSHLTGNLVVNLADGTLYLTADKTSAILNVEDVTTGSGCDRIVANDAVNVMTGGTGQDVFVFASLAALENAGYGIDKITDFEPGDRIDLSGLENEVYAFAAIKLFFGGQDADTNAIGAVTFKFEPDANQHDSTVVTGHLGAVDQGGEERQFVLHLDGHHDMTSQDFAFELVPTT